MDWLRAFLFTQLVECPLYGWALRRRGPVAFAIAFGASAITHPFVWFVFPPLVAAAVDPRRPASYPLTLALAEAFAVAVEAVYLARFGLRRAWAWSLAANAASFGLGMIVRARLGWF